MPTACSGVSILRKTVIPCTYSITLQVTLSLSTIVLNSRDWSEIVWRLEISDRNRGFQVQE